MTILDEIEIDRTTPTALGFYVVVSTVKLAERGQRIRVRLHRGGHGHSVYLDISTEIARDLWPILRRAGLLGERSETK
jgi:hypothetical protein